MVCLCTRCQNPISPACSGHQGIELALVNLYHITWEERYLKLSQFFLDQRGQKPSVFQREMENIEQELAGDYRHFFDRDGEFNTEYCQDSAVYPTEQYTSRRRIYLKHIGKENRITISTWKAALTRPSQRSSQSLWLYSTYFISLRIQLIANIAIWLASLYSVSLTGV